jgi:hypothetical protein
LLVSGQLIDATEEGISNQKGYEHSINCKVAQENSDSPSDESKKELEHHHNETSIQFEVSGYAKWGSISVIFVLE